ncbi:MAG: DUF3891 family protein [Rubinisphaera brasiliensis]|uniref:DUF3891 family protein n=1 Tax=Rubinisphaera brasiliensis TaxID=119 RepID=UPI00391B4D83
MLKTILDDEIWCVSQPDHGSIAGFLAAHWGNKNFARPGAYADAPDPVALQHSVVLGVAQHDNGWWEWEATPDVSLEDGLPLDLIDVLQSQQESMAKWRRGIPRLQQWEPYASLLTSYHAYWLYAPKCDPEFDVSFLHPLFGREKPPLAEGEEREQTAAFLQEIKTMQSELVGRLEADEAKRSWLRPEHLWPHARLVQLLDGLSLSLCSGIIPSRDGGPRGPGKSAFSLPDTPRQSWEDRVEIDVRPFGDGRILCDPYPFDLDPLPVFVPMRIFDRNASRSSGFATDWFAEPQRIVRFDLCSG